MTPSRARLSPAAWILAVWLIVGLLCLATGCQLPPAQPPHSRLPRADGLALAHHAARAIGGHVWEVHGVSMRPFLSDTAIVVTEAAAFSELSPGDVVVYRTARLSTTIHRLRARSSDGFAWIVCGDANAYSDAEHVTPANFLGRQVAVFFVQP